MNKEEAQKAVIKSITDVSHWNVEMIPESDVELIKQNNERNECIRSSQIRYRGWAYPYVSTNSDTQDSSTDWVSSWVQSPYAPNPEFWKFWKNGKFFHVFECRNNSTNEPEGYKMISNDIKPTGFQDATDTLKTLTEIFHFALNIYDSVNYKGYFKIKISMNNIKHRHLFFNMKYYHDFDFFTAPYCSEENLPMKKRTNVQGLKQYANSFAIDTLKVVFNTFKYNRSDFTVIEGIQREFIKGMI